MKEASDRRKRPKRCAAGGGPASLVAPVEGLKHADRGGAALIAVA